MVSERKMEAVDTKKLKEKIQYIFKTYGLSDVIKNKILKAISDTVTEVDVEHHEKWVNTDEYGDEWYCSGCHHTVNCDDYPTEYEGYQYCGKCGSKMDL